MKKLVIRHKKMILIAAVILITIIFLILFFESKHPFSRRAIREIQNIIDSYGDFSPIAVVALVFVSTAIPPLPIPIPLVEIAAGLVFGFWKGFAITWIAQIVSSFFAFYFVRIFGKRLLKKFFKGKFFNSYKGYLNTKGAKAVLTTRLTLVNPFNIVSFLAGLTNISPLKFGLATAIGSIPEVVIFTYIGSILKNLHHFKLSYLIIFIFLLGAFGCSGSFLMLRNKKN